MSRALPYLRELQPLLLAVFASLAVLFAGPVLVVALPAEIDDAPAEEGAAPARPNLLVIVADDLGFSDIGSYGGEIDTPHLDALARGGLRFTQFYNTARCWPTRTALLTGYYPQQVRMDPPRGRIPGWARVVPSALEPLGYRTYASGKWHLQGAPKPIRDGGFDRSFVVHDHDRFFYPKRIELDDEPLDPIAAGSGYYVTSAIAERALEFLGEHEADHADAPFFLYLAFTSPHFPLHALEEDVERHRERYRAGWDEIRAHRFERLKEMGIVGGRLSSLEPDVAPGWNLSPEELRERIGPGEAPRAVPWTSLTDEQKDFQALKMAIHAAMVHRMDAEIGRVIDHLRKVGELDDTVVLFLSDNGASAEQIIRGDEHDGGSRAGSGASYLCLGPGWSSAANTPFRRHKHWTHEGGCATPLIVHWPAGIPEEARGGLRRDAGHVIDIVPTLIDLAGGDGSAWRPTGAAPPLPGRSLMPSLARDRDAERELFFLHSGHRALRQGPWKLVSAKDEDDRWELYDLRDDRSEENDIAKDHPERVERMAARHAELVETFRDQAGEP